MIIIDRAAGRERPFCYVNPGLEVRQKSIEKTDHAHVIDLVQ